MSNSISNHTTDATHGATAVDTGETVATPSKLDALDPKTMTSDDIVMALKLDKEHGVTHTLAEVKEILIQKYQKSSPHASATDITEFTGELLADIQRNFPGLIVIPKKTTEAKADANSTDANQPSSDSTKNDGTPSSPTTPT